MALIFQLWMCSFLFLVGMWAWRIRGNKKFEANNYWAVLCHLKRVGHPKELRHLADDLKCDVYFLRNLLNRQSEEGYVWPSPPAVRDDWTTRVYQLSPEGESFLRESAAMLRAHGLDPGV